MSSCSFCHPCHPQRHPSQVLSPGQGALGPVEAHTELCSVASTVVHWENTCKAQHMNQGFFTEKMIQCMSLSRFHLHKSIYQYVYVPFVIFLELSWYESHRVGPCLRQLRGQHLESALGYLDDLKQTYIHIKNSVVSPANKTQSSIPNLFRISEKNSQTGLTCVWRSK